MTDLSTALPRILIVDDTPTNIETLVAVLEGQYDLSASTSGPKALALLEKGLRPDLILLDVMMPVMDGYDVCARIKADANLRDIPVIFITAKTDVPSETRALAIGAVDFIHKPISPAVVIARVGMHLGLVRQRLQLEQLNQQLKQTLIDKHEAELALAQARERELAMSSMIQQQLLFGVPPDDLPAFSIANYTQPSQGVAGDFFTFTKLGADSFEVLTGDVMGKGVAAALIAAGVKNAYLLARAEFAKRSEDDEIPSAAWLINAIHADITPHLIKLNSFVTMSLLRFDYSTRTVTWVNAGHTPTLLAKLATSEVLELMGDNLPVGVMEHECYEEHVTPFDVGDTLLLYSDGLSESASPENVLYGEDRIKDVLARTLANPVDTHALMEDLRNDLRVFTNDTPAVDDRTVVIVRPLPVS